MRLKTGHGGPRPGAGAKPALSEEDLARLLELHSQGIPQKSLARQFGIHHDTVRRYIRRAGL